MFSFFAEFVHFWGQTARVCHMSSHTHAPVPGRDTNTP